MHFPYYPEKVNVEKAKNQAAKKRAPPSFDL
jgi:hypothetical protein